MRIGIISGVLGLTVVLPAHAQKSDSIKSLLLPDVVVTVVPATSSQKVCACG